jgi:hypothetical protein
MGVKFENRPRCSCGVKMKLVEYRGYYDEFNYWCCDNCDLDRDIQDMKTDRQEKGSYA